MKKTIKHIAIQLLIILLPLGGLYLFAQHTFEENSKRQHRTDAGLGIAILLFFILAILFIYFVANTIVKYRKKEYKLLAINCVFLLIFALSILNIHCLIGGELFICDNFLNFIDQLL